MHELGIAASILQSAREEALRHPGRRVRAIRVRVGEFSGVNADALGFSFETLARDGEFGQVKLEIESCPRRQHCRKCGRTFRVVEYELKCPQCGTAETEFAGGDELELGSLEMEDYEPSSTGAQGP